MSVSIKDLERSRRVLGGISKDLDDDVNRLLHQLGIDIVEEAQSNLAQNNYIVTPSPLFDSIRIISETKDSLEVGTDIDYA